MRAEDLADGSIYILIQILLLFTAQSIGATMN